MSAARDWHIVVRTGGVYDSFQGTVESAQAECDRRNATDGQGRTELLCTGLTEAEARGELEALSGR